MVCNTAVLWFLREFQQLVFENLIITAGQNIEVKIGKIRILRLGINIKMTLVIPRCTGYNAFNTLHKERMSCCGKMIYRAA